MSEKELNKSDAIEDGTLDSEPKGGDNDSDVSEGSIAKTLGEALGRDFKDDETAIKSVKDTYGYVGKYGKLKPTVEKLQEKLGGEKNLLEFLEQTASSETAEEGNRQPQSDSSEFVPKDQYEKDQFFANNPEYKPYEKLISSIKKGEGVSYKDAVEFDEFKDMFDKASSHEDGDKSVIHSKSRLGNVTDKVSEADEALKSGNQSGANKSIIGAVMEEYEK